MNKGGNLNRVNGLAAKLKFGVICGEPRRGLLHRKYSAGVWIISALLVAMFFIHDFAVFAQKAEENQTKDIFDLVIPGSFGRIKEIYKGSTDKVIIYIQDAHLNYEAQTNIMNVLDLLVEDYGLRVAGIEGAGGVIETDLFASFPEDEIRGQVADLFMREGHLSGPETLVINKGAEYPLKLFGIEDLELYSRNFKAFQDSLPFKNEALGLFRRLNIALAQLKTQLYTKTIRDVDTQRLSYDLRLTPLNNYVEVLKKIWMIKVLQIRTIPIFQN